MVPFLKYQLPICIGNEKKRAQKYCEIVLTALFYIVEENLYNLFLLEREDGITQGNCKLRSSKLRTET
jgi:hypothetical protein